MFETGTGPQVAQLHDGDGDGGGGDDDELSLQPN
jgi:hypothetical protein